MSIAGIGVDLADLDRVSRLYERRGEAFASKWFTPTEIAQSLVTANPGRSLALRFCAKEAVWKALGVSAGGPLEWRAIAVLDGAGQQLEVELSGAILSAASRRGIRDVRVAVDRSGPIVVAIATATT